MPELPEVETIVRQLAPVLPGRHIRGVVVHHSDLLRPPAELFVQGVDGRQVERVGRRGKNIVLTLSGGGILLVNLGMTGRLLYLEGRTPSSLPAHPGVVFSLEPEGRLAYADVRRFGLLRLLTRAEWRHESARLGPEPLGRKLTGSRFHQALQKSRSPIRSWLLNQEKIAGVGNIYAAEALFRGRIHPLRPANTLNPAEGRALLRGLRSVLRQAIQARGTTLRDYRTATGEEGNFGTALRVYGREGEPCPRCKAPVVRIVFGNRSAFFCPRCQPEVS